MDISRRSLLKSLMAVPVIAAMPALAWEASKSLIQHGTLKKTYMYLGAGRVTYSLFDAEYNLIKVWHSHVSHEEGISIGAGEALGVELMNYTPGQSVTVYEDL